MTRRRYYYGPRPLSRPVRAVWIADKARKGKVKSIGLWALFRALGKLF